MARARGASSKAVSSTQLHPFSMMMASSIRIGWVSLEPARDGMPIYNPAIASEFMVLEPFSADARNPI
jgi:hypothetical protein